MDHKPLDGEQTAMDSSCQSILPIADKSCPESSTPVKKLDIHFVSPTPEKIDETLNIRCTKETAKLPEKYGILSDLFHRMTTSLRLLNLRKQLPTFHNICRQVEKLTGRKFSYRNLAQIKFILPEAIQTDKILLHNKKTLSMEPHIKVTLLFDVIEDHIEHSPYIALCRTFSDRLFQFVNTHSEDCDVPEADLPEPFNKKEITISTNSLPVDSSMKTLPNVDEVELLNPSHLPPSFSRHFTTKDFEESTKTEFSSSPISPSSIKSDTTNNKETGFSSCIDPVKHEKALQVANEDTPIKHPVTGHITIDTPDLSTPKRSVTTEGNKLKSMVSQNLIASNLSAKRSLDFLNDDEDVYVEEKTISANDPSAKVEDKNPDASKNDVIAQSGLKAREDTSTCLSNLVETIYNIFLSAHSSSITKSELVYKILVNNLDIEEIGEIDEQIELLENKVPEWIIKKVTLSGDLMYTIDKRLELKSVIEKLV